MGPAVGLGDAEVCEQERDRPGGHRGAAVGVDGELPAADALLRAGAGDELLGQGRGLAGGDHPADGVAGVDVEDDVEVVVRPFRGAVQLGDVPRPALIGPGRQQLGLDGRRVGSLAAALAGLARGAQQPVEGGLRAEVSALIQQNGPDLGRGQVREPRRVQGVQDRLALGRCQGTRLGPVPVRHRLAAGRRRAAPVTAVPAGLRHPGRPAGGPDADPRCQRRDRLAGHGVGPCLLSAPSESFSKSA